jgi:hypothetical protein
MVFGKFFERFRKASAVVTPIISMDDGESDKFTLQTAQYLDLIDTISRVAIVNPDVNQALNQLILLGNTGHNVSFDGLGDSEILSARQEIENLSDTITRGAGIDGFVNDLFRQVMITGALSVEWVPSDSLDGITDVVLVPVKEIRFKRRDGRWIPCHFRQGQEVELNVSQYQYIPISSEENSPYGIPPFISALRSIFVQNDGFENIKYILKKLGLLGMVSVKKEVPPRDADKSDLEWKSYLTKELIDSAEGFKQNFLSGIAVHYKDTEISHANITGDSRGASDLWKLIEEQVASGLNIPPALLGRTYSTTETYAGVVYGSFLASLNNVRRLVKRALERGYWLHLVMRGYSANRVTVSFRPDKSINSYTDAQTENLKVQTVIAKLNAGLIDPDTAAKELGYEKATGTVRQTSGMSNLSDSNVIQFAKKKQMM